MNGWTFIQLFPTSHGDINRIKFGVSCPPTLDPDSTPSSLAAILSKWALVIPTPSYWHSAISFTVINRVRRPLNYMCYFASFFFFFFSGGGMALLPARLMLLELGQAEWLNFVHEITYTLKNYEIKKNWGRNLQNLPTPLGECMGHHCIFSRMDVMSLLILC